MREIKLSQRGKNKGKYVALVDDEDFERTNKFKWHVQIDDNTIYVLKSMKENGKLKFTYLHSFIMNSTSVDHVDHNGLNNQKSNLRVCTRSQNLMNRKGWSKSGYKGIT